MRIRGGELRTRRRENVTKKGQWNQTKEKWLQTDECQRMLLEELTNASRGWQRNARERAHHPRVFQYFLFQIKMPFKETMSFKPFRSCLFHDVFTVFLFVFRIKAQGCGGSPVSTIFPHNRSFHCSLRSREFFVLRSMSIQRRRGTRSVCPD